MCILFYRTLCCNECALCYKMLTLFLRQIANRFLLLDGRSLFSVLSPVLRTPVDYKTVLSSQFRKRQLILYDRKHMIKISKASPNDLPKLVSLFCRYAYCH